MELTRTEDLSIKKQIEEWLAKPLIELECTFGKGNIDSTTFFQVAQRLRSKGMRELSQEDRLTISTPQHIRYTIQHIGAIQEYCKEDTLVGKSFVAMIKDRAGNDSQIDLVEYDMRIKSRSEEEIEDPANDSRVLGQFANWPTQDKAFRMMRRWSFEKEGSGLRYDLSIVRSTASNQKRQYIWQKKFTDQNISNAPYIYEIEVELQHLPGDTVEVAQKRLIRGIGEILRGIQKNSILIRKSKKEAVLKSYREFIQSNKFLGCYPVTLEQKNFTDVLVNKVPNIRNGYNVTDKADGLRCLGYTTSSGEFYLIDKGLNVYRTGLQQILCRESIIDGEWVTFTKEKVAINQFLAFDIYYATDKKNVSQYPFINKEDEDKSRHSQLKFWVETFNEGDGPKKLLSYLTPSTQLKISIKSFIVGNANDRSIFQAAAKVLESSKGRVYYTDGIIFTPNDVPLPINPGVAFRSQFKWKPSEDNTIDFLVRFEKYPENPKQDRVTPIVIPGTNELAYYKSMGLYVGSSRPDSYNPRDIILNDRKLTGDTRYRAIPFYPPNHPDTMACICYSKVQKDLATNEQYVGTELNNEPIQDNSIIEMRYDGSKPRGWRWIPLRIRHDKTERLQKGELGGTLNNEDAANSVWNSIHDPITLSMICSGSTQPNEEEIRENLTKIEARDNVTLKYFNERKDSVNDDTIVLGLKRFHNLYIKEQILYRSSLKGGKTLIDIACGKGSDIRRWNDNNVSFVLGIDYAGDNITNIENGIYARYITINNELTNAGREKLPPMAFVIGDTSKRLLDGTAGTTEQEQDILRSVFGRYKPSGPPPPFIEREATGNLRGNADAMSCMFALHYFFKNKEMLSGLLQNIRECVKLGGYFIGCCFDGESVFNLLKNTEKGGVKTGKVKQSTLWNIQKEYDEIELLASEESIGLKINVDFISINAEGGHDEYLVSFPYFTERMKEIGFELLNDQELKEVGLNASTNMFGTSYSMMKDSGKKYYMPPSIEQFSFLNRWFIFKKRKDAGEEEEEEEYIPLVNTRKKNATITTEETQQEIIEDNPITAESVASNEEEMLESEVERESLTTAKRTIPVEKAAAAPNTKTYTSNQVVNFYIDATLDDKKLKMGDKGAARWLDPISPFPIQDTNGIEYPSIDHFLAGMMYKYGADSPLLAESTFTSDGTIHSSFRRKRMIETQATKKPTSEDTDFKLLKAERTEIHKMITEAAFKKAKVVYNGSKYAAKKDELLEYAVKYRYDHDKRLRDILDAARLNHKYLLYYTPGTTANDLGGQRKMNDVIQGDNKLGKLYMKFASIVV